MTMLTALGELRENATRKFEEFCVQITFLEEKVKVVSQRETDLQNVTVTADKAKLDDLLLLNFGGEHIDVVRSTLLLYPGRNGIITLLSGKYDHLLPRHVNGRIFFDFDKRFVEPMFSYCRDLAKWNGEEASKPIHVPPKDKRSAGEQKVIDDYFKATSPLNKAQRSKITQESLIVSELHSFDERALFDMFPNENQFASATLLYRGSRDGFKARDFHDKCDGKPNTVTIIRDTEGNVFGGYASVPWWSPGKEVCVPDSSAFLFSLAEESKVSVVQHKPLAGKNAGVYHYRYSSAGFRGKVNTWSDLVIWDNCSSGITNNGKLGGSGYDSTGNVIPRWTAGKAFCVQEIEVFQLHKHDFEKCHSSEKGFVSAVSPPCSKRKRAANDGNDETEMLSLHTETVSEQEIQLQNEADVLIAELQFVAKHCGVTLPPRSEPVMSVDGDDNDEVDQFASALAYIRELGAVLQSSDVTVGCRVVDTVTINAGGRLVTTAKATLQHTPEGSILANMTSDVWGHGLDRDGNIYQDVNSELFVAIINHLRLKQLLGGTSIQVVPPIVVYEEQKTALDNLLSFYMLTDDLPVKTVKH